MKIRRADVVQGVLVLVVLASLAGTWQTQRHLDSVTTCNARVMNDLVTAVNERTTYTEAAQQRTSELWNEQSQLVEVLARSSTEEERINAFEGYRRALGTYREVQEKARAQRTNFPYPQPSEVQRCR